MFSGCVSGRTGNGIVGIVSGFACASQTDWISGLALHVVERIFPLPPVGKLLPDPVFCRTSVLPFM